MTLLRVLPSANRTASAPSTMTFRGLMAGLHVPLPTLRLHPRGCRRTARGRCGSLFLTSRWTFTTNSSPVLSRRTLFFGESPLGAHYNRARPHMALGPGVPDPPTATQQHNSRSRHRLREDVAVRANAVLGGLHHEYFLAPNAALKSICG
jgi:hypothetical protein